MHHRLTESKSPPDLATTIAPGGGDLTATQAATKAEKCRRNFILVSKHVGE